MNFELERFILLYELILKILPLATGGDAQGEFFDLNRFREVVNSPRLKSLDFFLDAVDLAQQQHRNLSNLRNGF